MMMRKKNEEEMKRDWITSVVQFQYAMTNMRSIQQFEVDF